MRVDGVDENVRNSKGRQGGADEDDETEQQRPLMTEDERMPAAAPGALRSYAHRDIKPGEPIFSLTPFTTIH
jgi:serine/threonine kinase 16